MAVFLIFKTIIMKLLIGKNTDFKAVFDCSLQTYTVYYKNKIIVSNKYKYSEIKSYLD